MASSSSAKKVARVAARSGSGSQVGSGGGSAQRNWIFAASVVVIVALGVGVVAFARSENPGLGDNTISPKANLGNGEAFDHWHAAFAVNICGTELPALSDSGPDAQGIHTHSDGLVHIHPFVRTAAGDRATFGKFFDQTALTVTDTGFQLPPGVTTADGATTVKEGETTCGGEEGELVMAHWENALAAEGSEPDDIIRSGFRNIRFTEDGGAFTLAFVPVGSTDIAPPSTAAEIFTLGACDGENPPPECFPEGIAPGTDPLTAPGGEGLEVEPEIVETTPGEEAE